MQPNSPIAPFINTHNLFEAARAMMTPFNNNPCKETLTPYCEAVAASGKDLQAKKSLITDKALIQKIEELYLAWRALHIALVEISHSPDLAKCTREKTVLLVDTWKQVNRKCMAINALASQQLDETQPAVTERTALLFKSKPTRSN